MPTELTFVGPEEAAKWPEGTKTLMAKRHASGRWSFHITDRPDLGLQKWARFGVSHFFRLPDSLPEVERNASL